MFVFLLFYCYYFNNTSLISTDHLILCLLSESCGAKGLVVSLCPYPSPAGRGCAEPRVPQELPEPCPCFTCPWSGHTVGHQGPMAPGTMCTSDPKKLPHVTRTGSPEGTAAPNSAFLLSELTGQGGGSPQLPPPTPSSSLAAQASGITQNPKGFASLGVKQLGKLFACCSVFLSFTPRAII